MIIFPRSELIANTGEEVVLPGERGADMKTLDDAVVDGNDTVLEEARQCHLVVEQVLDGLAERGRRRLMRSVRPTPGNQLIVDGLAPRAPRGEPLVGGEVPHLVFHLVERLECW
jgi:hypothetical protein